MKRNLLHVGVSVLAAMILAACSGGGGDGSSNPPAEQQAKPVQPAMPGQVSTPSMEQAGNSEQSNSENNKNIQPNVPQEDKPSDKNQSEGKNNGDESPDMKVEPPKQEGNQKADMGQSMPPFPNIDNPSDETISGIQYKIPSHGKIPQEIKDFTGRDINKLVVDGRNIELVAGNKNEDGIIQIIGVNEHTRWGAIHVLNGKYDHLFAIGQQATKVENMPADNSATYLGDVAHFEGDQSPQSRKVNLTVDFGKKELNGEITSSNAQSIKLHGNISGNGFEGMTQEGTFTRGGFYGENASELIGTYQSENPDNWYMGAYGAKKQ